MIDKSSLHTFSYLAQKASAMPDYKQENLSALDNSDNSEEGNAELDAIRKNTPVNSIMLQYYLEQLAYIERVEVININRNTAPIDLVNTTKDNVENLIVNKNSNLYILKKNGMLFYSARRQSTVSVTLDSEKLKILHEKFNENFSEDENSDKEDVIIHLDLEKQKNITHLTGHNPFDHQSIIIQLRTTMLLLGHAAITAAKLGKPVQHLLDQIERCYQQIQKWSPNEEKTRAEKKIDQHIDYLAYLMGYKLDDVQKALETKELVFLNLGNNFKLKIHALMFTHIKEHLKSRSGFLLINEKLYYADFKKSTLNEIVNDEENNYANDIKKACIDKTETINPLLAHKIKVCLPIKVTGNVIKRGFKAIEKPRAFFTQTYAILSPLIKLLSTCLAYAKRLQKIANDSNKKSDSDMVNLIIALVLFPLRLLAFIYAIVDTRKSSKFALKERFLRAFDEYGRDLWSGLFAATINCMTYFWLTGSGNLEFVGKVTSISVFAGVDVVASLFGGIRAAKRQRALVTMMRKNLLSIADTNEMDELNELIAASDTKINQTIKKILNNEKCNNEEKALRTKQIWAILFVMRKAHAEYIHHRNTYIINTLHSLLSAAASAMITFPVFPVFLGPAITLLASIVNNIALSINDIYKTSRIIENLESEDDQNEAERSQLDEQRKIKAQQFTENTQQSDLKNEITEITTHLNVFQEKRTQLQEKIAYHHALRTYQKIVAVTNTIFDAAVTIGMLAVFTFLPFGVIPILIAAGIMLVSMLIKAIGENVLKDKIIEAKKVSHYSIFKPIEMLPSDKENTLDMSEESKNLEQDPLLIQHDQN